MSEERDMKTNYSLINTPMHKNVKHGSFSTEKSVIYNSSDSINECTQSLSSETVKVYLRIKPCSLKKKLDSNEEVYNIHNSTTLLTKFPPCDNIKATKKTKADDIISRKYVFTKIFEPNVSQEELFDRSVKTQLINFLTGQNVNIMAYGTTNSGKTYSMFGTNTDPGIIPYSIEFIFTAINCTLCPWYKPTECFGVIVLDETRKTLEARCREKLLGSSLNANNHEEINKFIEDFAFNMNDDKYIKDSKEYNSGKMFSIWLSFFEIYNENIFDLLSENRNSDVPLKLMKDKCGTSYVRDLRSVYATTAAEARKILSIGHSRAKVAQTSLNSESSRSHTIFNIKLCKHQEINAPEEVEINSLTFCDLAGSGRFKKTSEDEKRSVESRNINSSLLVLGKCLKAVWRSQPGKQEYINGPFRESKLTSVFQKALTGRDNLSLLVTIDYSPNLYMETHGILDICTVAKKIIIKSTSKEMKKSNLSELTPENTNKSSCSGITISSPVDAFVSENVKLNALKRPLKSGIPKREETNKKLSVTEVPSQKINPEKLIPKKEVPQNMKNNNENDKEKRLKEENEKLRKEVEILKAKLLSHEDEIHKELADSYATVIDDLETNWKERADKITEEAVDEAIKKITSDKSITEENYNRLKCQNMDLIKQLEIAKTDSLNREIEVRNELADYYSKLIEEVDDKWKRRTQALEEESQDLLKWSVDQVESFYKERINNIVQTKKRKKLEENDLNEEASCVNCEELENENVHLTSKSVVLKQEAQKLKNENEMLLTKNNENIAEIRSMKVKLSRYEELAAEFIEMCYEDFEEDESITIIDKLKLLFEKKLKITANLEKDLNDVRDEYLNNMANLMSTEQELFKLRETLHNNRVEIDSLKSKLLEKTMYVEILELQIQDIENVKSDILQNVATTANSNVSSDDLCPNYNCQPDNEGCYDSNVECPTDCVNRSNQFLFRSSDESSHNDSGISARSRRTTIVNDACGCVDVDEKYVQASLESSGKNIIIQEKIEQLKIDYSTLKDQHVSESIQVNKLSDELSVIKEMMGNLIKICNENEHKISEYEKKVRLQQQDLDGVNDEKTEALLKYHELSGELKTRTHDYERKINELSNRLRIKEDSGNRTSRCLEEYLEKSASLENQLAALNAQFERSSIRCITEHIPRIEELEKESLNKSLRINELENKLAQTERDIIKIYKLNEKVNEFENILDKCQKEKADFCRQLHERTESLSSLESKLKKFVMKIVDKESDVMVLRSPVGNIMDTGSSNNLQVKELNESMIDMVQTIKTINEELLRTEEARKSVEKCTEKEIISLKSCLSTFEGNSSFVNSIGNTDEEKEAVCERGGETNLSESNRESITEKYEYLVNQLEFDIEQSKADRDKKLESVLPKLNDEQSCACIEEHKEPCILEKSPKFIRIDNDE